MTEVNPDNLILIRDILGVEIYKDKTTDKEYLSHPNGTLELLEVKP